MPDGEPGPDEIERRLRELTKEVDKQRDQERKARDRLAKKTRARGRRPQWAISTVAAIVILAGGAFTYLGVDPRFLLRGPASNPSPFLSGPPADPFAGSPANAWADGAAGITIPAAAPHGSFTTAQVRSAYATTRDLLIAQDLNWPTLRGGYPSAFEQVLPSWYRSQFVAGLDKTGVSKDGTYRSTRNYVTSFAPGTTQFVTQVVKVHGGMTTGTATNSGTQVLRINFDYLFTYAVEPPGKAADWMRVVQQQYGNVEFTPGSTSTIYAFSFESGTAGELCDVTDGYIHPGFPQGPPPSVQPSGPAQNPYSLATPGPGTGNTCRPTTGT